MDSVHGVVTDEKSPRLNSNMGPIDNVDLASNVYHANCHMGKVPHLHSNAPLIRTPANNSVLITCIREVSIGHRESLMHP